MHGVFSSRIYVADSRRDSVFAYFEKRGVTAIENKWVLKIKRKAHGSIKRYKACLMTKGYIQREEVTYEETFSPVVTFASIRTIRR